MNNRPPSAAAKIHPASRELLPDDPMELQGVRVPGDPDLMLRMLVEEYARIGWDTDAIMGLAHDPNYRGFNSLLQRYGERPLREKISAVLSRTGVMRVISRETAPASETLVELTTEFPAARRADHG